MINKKTLLITALLTISAPSTAMGKNKYWAGKFLDKEVIALQKENKIVDVALCLQKNIVLTGEFDGEWFEEPFDPSIFLLQPSAFYRTIQDYLLDLETTYGTLLDPRPRPNDRDADNGLQKTIGPKNAELLRLFISGVLITSDQIREQAKTKNSAWKEVKPRRKKFPLKSKKTPVQYKKILKRCESTES